DLSHVHLCRERKFCCCVVARHTLRSEIGAGMNLVTMALAAHEASRTTSLRICTVGVCFEDQHLTFLPALGDLDRSPLTGRVVIGGDSERLDAAKQRKFADAAGGDERPDWRARPFRQALQAQSGLDALSDAERDGHVFISRKLDGAAADVAERHP